MSFKKCIYMKIFNFLFFLLFLVGIHTSVDASNSDCKNNHKNLGNRTLNQLYCFNKNPPGPVTVELPSGESITLTSDEIIYQEQAFLKSVLGMELQAQTEFDEKEASYEKDSIVEGEKYEVSSYENTSEMQAIIDLASSTSVVMLNEAHHVSRHRMFALKLAKGLKQKGFTHIAAETFYDVDTMMELGFPTTDNGVYIKDPEFGHFIRQSMQLGYKLVEYESSESNREEMQARNLAKFLRENPRAKVLVYAGYSHIRELPEKRMMASIFKSISGINPLSIDQVGGTSRYSAGLTDPIYSQVKNEISQAPTIFKDKSSGKWLVSKHYSGDVDITVFHAEEYIKNGRANWLVLSPERKEYEIDIQDLNLNLNENFVVKAVLESEYQAVEEKAIPIDQLLVSKNSKNIKLYLPPGSYLVFLERIGDIDSLLKKIEVSE